MVDSMVFQFSPRQSPSYRKRQEEPPCWFPQWMIQSGGLRHLWSSAVLLRLLRLDEVFHFEPIANVAFRAVIHHNHQCTVRQIRRKSGKTDNSFARRRVGYW